MMTIPTSATPKHMPTPINRTTSTARIASSRATILIRLMAPNDTPNNTAVPGFFMVQQDYHTARSPLRIGLVLALLARLAVIDLAQRLPSAAQWTRCPLHGHNRRTSLEPPRRLGRLHGMVRKPSVRVRSIGSGRLPVTYASTEMAMASFRTKRMEFAQSLLI